MGVQAAQLTQHSFLFDLKQRSGIGGEDVNMALNDVNSVIVVILLGQTFVASLLAGSSK